MGKFKSIMYSSLFNRLLTIGHLKPHNSGLRVIQSHLASHNPLLNQQKLLDMRKPASLCTQNKPIHITLTVYKDFKIL